MRVLVRLTGITLTDDRDLEVPGNIVARFEYLNADGSPKIEPAEDDDDDARFRRRRTSRARGRLNVDHDQALELVPHLFRTVYLEVTPASLADIARDESPATSTSSSAENPTRNPGPVFAGSYNDGRLLPEVPDVPAIIADGKTYPARR